MKLSKISLSLAIFLAINSLVFSFIAFSVPDWLQYEANGYPIKLGLWDVCTSPITFFSKFSCTPWNIYQLETPAILECLSIIVSVCCGILAVFLKKNSAQYLAFIAGAASFVGFLFAISAIVIFARDYEIYFKSLAIQSNYLWRRWAYWLLVPITFALFIASILFPFEFIQKRFSTINKNNKSPINNSNSIRMTAAHAENNN